MQNPSNSPDKQATAQDRDSQQIATGTASVYSSESRGTFFPEPNLPLRPGIAESVRSLKIAERVFQVCNFELCESLHPEMRGPIVHYHFDVA
jgi:hypothetical protein